MKPQNARISMIVLSLLLGGAGLIFNFRLLQDRERAAFERGKLSHETPAIETVTVLRATKPIPRRAPLDRSSFEPIDVPRAFVPPDSVIHFDEVADTYTRSEIAPDDILRRCKVASRDEALSLTYRVPPGMRAVAIASTEPKAVAFALDPGDRVDVIALLQKDSTDSDSDSIARTVLQDLEVLEASTSPDQPEKRSPAPTVTVAATPEQAQLLSLLEDKAKLVLTLRSVRDRQVASVDETAFASVLGLDLPAASEPTPEKPKAPIIVLGSGTVQR